MILSTLMSEQQTETKQNFQKKETVMSTGITHDNNYVRSISDYISTLISDYLIYLQVRTANMCDILYVQF